MALELDRPDVNQLSDVIGALRQWQRDDAPLQLHPGDLGWHWRFGAEAVAAAIRTWRRAGELLAVGFLDGPDVLRLTLHPEVWHEEEPARQIAADVGDPERGVLPSGTVAVEAPNGTRVQERLSEAGWRLGEPWTPLRHDLATPFDEGGLQIRTVELEQVPDFTAVHRSAWGSARFTDERWQTMADGLPYRDAGCLLGYDDQGVAVAGVTVWSAGPGRPGLLEPMGVHADHRRHGYGRAICVAAAAELHRRGASSALVCTPSALASAVTTYEAAGFRRLPERLDRTRDA